MVRAACALVAVLVAVLLSACGSAGRAPEAPAPSAPAVPPPSSAPAAAPPSVPTPPPPPPVAAPGKKVTIQLTGYSYADNTPPGSSEVCCAVLHQVAGGQGTFEDPITVAVPGSGGQGMLYAKGTKFYLPTVQRYVIVEDSGAAKQPAGTDTHLDMWIDGQDGTKQATDDCENLFTGKVPAQVNPAGNLPVMAGPIFANGKCNVPPQAADMGTYSASGDDSGDGGSSDDSGSGHHHHHDDDNSDNSDSGDNGNG
jgi:hypothetical protein